MGIEGIGMGNNREGERNICALYLKTDEEHWCRAGETLM